MSADSTASHSRPSLKRSNNIQNHQRAYKACLSCRNRKAKCDLGENGSPPCARCRREMRECLFSTNRSTNGIKRYRTDDSTDKSRQESPTQVASHIRPRAIVRGNKTDSRRNSQAPGYVQPSTALDYSNSHDSPALPPRSALTIHADRTQAATNNELTSSVIRTVVSSGNDALRILFEAATQERETNSEASPGLSPHTRDNHLETTAEVNYIEKPKSGRSSFSVSKASPETLRLWNTFRFVRMGWFSAQEAVTYLDLFYKNMSSWSPILTNTFSIHAMHPQLITQEPLLCCTLLMISSRYHTLSGPSGVSRSFFVHNQLWEHCQEMIMSLIFGQEKGTPAKMRTEGSIEALLLISEWHPRSLHFPPKTDGWDTNLTVNDLDFATDDEVSPGQKWLEDVIEPARKSDRMSWMLLGCAVSLAHELDVFRDEENLRDRVDDVQFTSARRLRVRRLLYVYTNQLASRLGCTSLYPQQLSSMITGLSSPIHSERLDDFMTSWIELTKLLKSWSDLVFPSATATKQLLHSGRYISLLEHYKPLLGQWSRRHLVTNDYADNFRNMLFIEYQYLRIYCNSLGMQAVCERSLVDGGFDTDFVLSVGSIDHACIQEVIESGCSILKTLVAFAESDALRFSPVRIFLRATTASIYLFKAVSLGVRNGQLLSTFTLLDHTIQALRSSTLDEMHLASRYATLLEMHVTRLRRGFQKSSRPTFPNLPLTRPPSNGGIRHPTSNESTETMSLDNGIDLTIEDSTTRIATNDFDAFLQDISADDWLSLPFDPSMAPFNTSNAQPYPPAFDDTTLDFIWNIPT